MKKTLWKRFVLTGWLFAPSLKGHFPGFLPGCFEVVEEILRGDNQVVWQERALLKRIYGSVKSSL